MQPEGGRQTSPYSGSAMAAVAASERPTVGAIDFKYVPIPSRVRRMSLQEVFIEYSLDWGDARIARGICTPISPATAGPGFRPFCKCQKDGHGAHSSSWLPCCQSFSCADSCTGESSLDEGRQPQIPRSGRKLKARRLSAQGKSSHGFRPGTPGFIAVLATAIAAFLQ